MSLTSWTRRQTRCAQAELKCLCSCLLQIAGLSLQYNIVGTPF